MTITITGSPSQEAVTASTTLVTPRDFRAVPRRTSEDALRLVPGVTLVQHGSEGKGYQFLVRGFDAAHGSDFEVTVDGIPINEWSNVHAQGYLDLGFIIPEAVSTARVTKGPFTLHQGAFALAGTADYHLGVADDDLGLYASYTVGTTNRHRGVVMYSPREGDGHDFIASETVHDDGFGVRRGVNKGALLGRRRFFGSERSGRLSFLGAANIARFELPGALRDDDLTSERIGFRDSYSERLRGASLRALSGLDYQLRRGATQVQALVYGGARRLEIFESFTGYLHDRQHGDFRLQQQDAFSLGAKLQLSRVLLAGFTGHLAAGTAIDRLEQRQQHTDEAERPLTLERGLAATQALTHVLAGFGLAVGDSLHADAGVRLDLAHVSVRDAADGDARGRGTLTVASPRAVVEWRVIESTRLFAAYGRGFRPPEARSFSRFSPAAVGLSEETYDGGEPSMTVSDSLELGTRLRFGSHFSAQLSTFATFIARESIYDHVSGSNVELNGTRRLGGELSLRVSPVKQVEIKADATALDARFVASGNPVPLAPTLFGSILGTIGAEHGPRAGLRLAAVAPRPLPHAARSATFTQLDATAGYIWPAFRLELEVENLLNRHVREAEYHFASYWPGASAASEIPALHYVPGPPLNARLTLTAKY